MDCCDVAPAPPPGETMDATPVMAKRQNSKEDGVASQQNGGEVQDPARLAELYFISSVQAGDWPKAGELTRILERRRVDREICRAAAKAAEHIAVQPRGLDALTECGAQQQLAEAWLMHRNDTALAVHAHNVVARFWERAGNDDQWFLLPTSVAAGKALVATGHPEWLAEAHRAAVRLHEKGNSAAAMDIYRLTVERLEQALGAADQSTLQAQNNLAVLLEERGQLEEASRLHQAVCEKLETNQGAEHPDTLSSKFNQAALKAKQGKLQEAETLYRLVAEQRERTLGAQHADALRAKGNLAELLRKQGRLPEAEQLLRAVVDRRHSALGRDDPGTLKSRCQLALVLAQQGDAAGLKQAEAHLREVVARREIKLGRGHPDTLASLSLLAFLLEEGRPAEAETLHEQVWQWLDAAAPPERRRARSRQGRDFLSGFEEIGEPQRAEAMLRQVVERRRSALGASHPDALAARSELAGLLARSGNAEFLAEALSMQREVVEMSEATLSLNHVDTLAARAALAGSILRKGAATGGTAATEARTEAEAMHLETCGRFGNTAAASGSNLPGDGGARMPGSAAANVVSSPGKRAVLMRD